MSSAQMLGSLLFYKREGKIMKKCVEKLEMYILQIELSLLLATSIASFIIQILVIKIDLSRYLDWPWLISIYTWIKSVELNELLVIIDSFAIIVGGISFFLKKWVEKDSENIVFLLVIVFALLLSHIFKFLDWYIVSFSISSMSGVLLCVPFAFLIHDSLICSKRRTLKRNKIKFKTGGNK